MSLLLSLSIVLAQVTSPGLEAALAGLEEGTPVTVTDGVAAEAIKVARTRQDLAPEQLDRHLQVAVLGGALEPLAPVLARLLASDGPAVEPALRAASAFGSQHRPALFDALGDGSARARVIGRHRLLIASQDPDEKIARGAIVVVAGVAPPEAVRDLLQRLLAEDEPVAHATLALEVITTRPPSRELFDALLRACQEERPVPLQAPLARTLASFIDKEPKLGGALLDALRQGPTPALLGGMVALPPDRWNEAVAWVVELVTQLAPSASEETPLLVAAIGAGGDLRAADLLPVLPELCLPSVPLPVRVAALRAMGDLGAREAGTVDVLLTYIAEPAPVGPTAFLGLRQRTGAKLPLRPILWRDWRARTTLEELTPEEHAERLAQDRLNRFRERQLAMGRS